MKSKFMRGLALGLAMVTAFTFSAPNSALLNAQAAKAKMTASAKKIKAGGTVTYKVTNLNKKYYYTVKVTGAGKKLVQVKKGKTTVKAYKKTAVSKKAKVGAKTLTLKATNNSKKTSAQKYTVTVKVYKTKNAKKAFKTFKTTTTIKKKAAAVKEVAATGVTLDKDAYAVGINQTVTPIVTVAPTDTTDKAVWTSSDESVATVANGVITGVKEGKATITVTYREGVSASAEVTVSKDAIVYSLTNVKQVSADSIELTFDNEYAANLTKNSDIAVTNVASGTATELVLHPASIKWSTDGKVGVATLDGTLQDKVTYNVSFKEMSPLSFVASVGAVSSISILTATAQEGVPTKVEYAFYDAQGIDVSSTVKYNYVTVSQEGATTTNTDAEKFEITMDTVGSKATVTVTYQKDSADPIVGTGTITCVDTQATLGEGVFKMVSADDAANLVNTNDGNGCAKFYLSGMNDTSVTVQDGVESSNIYFYAKDENGNAINYENYEITSADSSKATADISEGAGGGKFIKFTVTGYLNDATAANVNLNITATKYGKSTVYTIPVKVVKKATMSRVEVSVNKSSVSNAFDEDYYGELTAKVIDTAGNKMDDATVKLHYTSDKVKTDAAANVPAVLDASDAHVTGFFYAVDSMTGVSTANIKTNSVAIFDDAKTAFDSGAVDASYTMSPNGDKEYKAFYKAWGAKANTYTMEIEATDSDGNKKTGRASVTVDALDDTVWSGGYTLSYKVDLDDKTVDEAKQGDSKTTARLAGYAGSKFAGYVREATGATAAIGGVASDSAAHANAFGKNSSGSTTSDGTATWAAISDGTAKLSTNAKQLMNIRPYIKKSGQNKLVRSGVAANLYGYYSTGSAAGDGFTTSNDGVTKNTSTTVAKVDINTVDWANIATGYYCPSNSQLDKYYASTGTYKVGFIWSERKLGASSWDTNKISTLADLTVKNTLVAPTVTKTISGSQIDSLDPSSVKDVLVTNVDMNNNDDANKSIETTMYSKVANYIPSTEQSDSKKFTVKYVTVKDNWDGKTHNFLVPIGNGDVNFTAK